MSRPNPFVLFLFLCLVIAGMGGVAVFKGGFYVAKHEGDTLHLLQIVFRMADGEWPHLDFMTPIGIMAFWPISKLVQAGQGIGAAILWSQITVALVLLLPTWWAAYSRFNNALAYLFGMSVMILILALVHGQSDQLVSISMHYNRWAWAVAYIVLVLAILPGKRVRNGAVDGVFIGLGLAFLALCKVTYFISFAPVVLIAFILHKQWIALAASLGAGLAVVGWMTALAGVGFWPAYIGDVLTVAGSDVRPQPGAPLNTIIGAPAFIGGSLAVLFGVVFLRQSGEDTLGLLLLLLVPGFLYVTYQNFGNDPQWLMLLAILLLAPRPDSEEFNSLGWPLGKALAMTSMAAIAFATPSFTNLAYSPFRHLNVDPEKYTPFLAASAQHADLFGRIVRANRVDGNIALDRPGTGLEDRREIAKRKDTLARFNGEALPECELQLGIIAWFETITADLEAAGFSGKKLFATDIFVSHWLFGDVERLAGGSPWYYGGLPGLQDADYLIIPMCPASQSIRAQLLKTIEEQGITLTEVYRHPLYILAEAKS